jgi:hypothetical protein
VHSSVSTAPGAAAGVEGSTGSSGSNSTAGAPPESAGDVDAGGSVSSAGAHSSGGLPLMHTVDAFAVLIVQIVRSPGTANTRGAGRVFDPAAGQAPAAPAAAGAGSQGAASGQQHARAFGAGKSSSNSGSGSSSGGWQSNSSVQVQLAACALLAAVTLQHFNGQLWLLLLQLLLLAVLAATAIKAPGLKGSSSSSSSSSGSSQATSGSSAGRPQPAAWLQGSSGGSSSSSTEDPKCCGWSMMLIGADLCSAPGRHLQLQVGIVYLLPPFLYLFSCTHLCSQECRQMSGRSRRIYQLSGYNFCSRCVFEVQSGFAVRPAPAGHYMGLDAGPQHGAGAQHSYMLPQP